MKVGAAVTTIMPKPVILLSLSLSSSLFWITLFGYAILFLSIMIPSQQIMVVASTVVQPKTDSTSSSSVGHMAMTTSSSKPKGHFDSSENDNDDDDIDDDDENNSIHEQSKCGLYLATSSTSTVDEFKWGVFAGKDLKAASRVGYGDIAINTFHLMANQIYMDHEGKLHDDLDDNYLANLVDWFEQYVWVPTSSGGQFELKGGTESRIVTAIPGIGVIGGYNPKMTNADWNHSSAYHRDVWNEHPGVPHVGRGSYSNYYNLELATTEVIPAGKEIFINYGDNWEEENPKEKEQLTKKDYDKVDKTIEKFIAFFNKYKEELDDESKNEIYQFLTHDIMSAAAGIKKGKQIANMLPNDPSDLQAVLDKGGSFYLSSPTAIRKIDWLETNGRCMDNIKPGPSTISYAGRGAFATRNITKGSLVAPVPLIQLPAEAIFDMYKIKVVDVPAEDTSDEDDAEVIAIRDGDDPVGKQLLYNYCYGHPESTMMFFPVGAVANYINHNPKDKANARMVWSDHPNNHKHWFDIRPNDLIADGTNFIGLMMEIVATRDIKEGEEIFLDYGPEWQAAWEEHVEEWNKDKPSTWPMRALDYMHEHKDKFFRTKDEEPYPDNVMVKCFLMVKKPEDGHPKKDEQGRSLRVWSESESGKSNIVSDNLFDCEIVSASETSEGKYYDVAWSNGKSITIVKDVPHKAIVILDKPETGDQHLTNSFRHYIGIPDDIFPQGPWRNYNTEDDGEEDDEEEEEEEEEVSIPEAE